ncbi:outer membrane lipoprotein Blc isoform X1 [Hydra vulgaris]|uniref:outer membrane lipoprotein Blc isoform X1 n=1 Tax=Hydra vulgaris TaxID=6087 RepID=UPI001F5FAE7B|nr:outer membrane lipoprotein Blc isoform X1 [Hydra vulgaris]
MRAFVLFFVFGICLQVQAGFFEPIITVDQLDINKYLGRWYEISSSMIPKLTFEKNLVCTTATYSLQSDGSIKVFNAGRILKPTGLANNATGKAVVVRNGTLLVTFPQSINFFNANYFVVKLGNPTFGTQGLYEYAIVTTPFRLTTWVLARDPQSFFANYQKEVKDYLKYNGYNWFWNKPTPTVQTQDCIYPE